MNVNIKRKAENLSNEVSKKQKGQIQIFVKNPSNETNVLSIDKDELNKNLYNKISNLNGIPENYFYLTYQSKIISNNDDKLNLETNSTILVILRNISNKKEIKIYIDNIKGNDIISADSLTDLIDEICFRYETSKEMFEIYIDSYNIIASEILNFYNDSDIQRIKNITINFFEISEYHHNKVTEILNITNFNKIEFRKMFIRNPYLFNYIFKDKNFNILQYAIYYDNYEFVKELMKFNNDNININKWGIDSLFIMDIDNLCCLEMASGGTQENSSKIINELLNYTFTNNLQLSLNKYRQIFKNLIRTEKISVIDSNFYKFPYYNFLPEIIIKEGKTNIIASLLENDVLDIDNEYNDSSLLESAVINDKVDIVDYLVRNGAKVDTEKSPFSIANRNKFEEIAWTLSSHCKTNNICELERRDMISWIVKRLAQNNIDTDSDSDDSDDLGSIKLRIDTSNVIGTSRRALSSYTNDRLISRNLNIIYYDSSNTYRSIGQDYGGLTKDWISNLIIKLCNENNFTKIVKKSNETHEYYLQPNSNYIDYSNRLELLGKILGLSIIHKIPIGIKFSEVLCKQLMIDNTFTPTENDLKDIDPQLFNSLQSMKKLTLDELKDLDVSVLLENINHLFTLNNEIITLNSYDELNELIKLVTKHRVVNSVSLGVKKLRKGLHSIIPESMLVSILTPLEFSNILLGIDGDKLYRLWKRKTIYTCGYDKFSDQVRWFWRFIKNSNESTKRNILKWTTGFNSLDENGFDNSLFTISKNLGHTENHLPQVHTCSLILQLPEYDSYNTLVDKFNIAMGERNFGII